MCAVLVQIEDLVESLEVDDLALLGLKYAKTRALVHAEEGPESGGSTSSSSESASGSVDAAASGAGVGSRAGVARDKGSGGGEVRRDRLRAHGYQSVTKRWSFGMRKGLYDIVSPFSTGTRTLY